MSVSKRLSVALAIWCVSAWSPIAPSSISAQAIQSYEFTFASVSGGVIPKPLNAPAVAVSCVVGRAPASPGPVWLQPTDPFKVVFEPDATRVCTWTGPTVQTMGFSPGSLYTSSAVAINEAGIRSVTASPASNPFGQAGPPPTILRVVVPSGS